MLNKICSLIGGFFGAMGGSEKGNKLYRKLGLSLLTLCVVSFFKGWSYWNLLCFGLFGIFSCGYGITDKISGDKGSPIGNFWLQFVKDPIKVNYPTRGTIAVLVSILLLFIPILYGNWFKFILESIIWIVIYATCSWRNWGTIGKLKLLKTDLFVYGYFILYVFFLVK